MSKEMPPRMRTCYACKHFDFVEGSPGYSELTPGSDWSIGCNESVWEFSGYHDTREDFARCLDTAKTCPKFALRGER